MTQTAESLEEGMGCSVIDCDDSGNDRECSRCGSPLCLAHHALLEGICQSCWALIGLQGNE